MNLNNLKTNKIEKIQITKKQAQQFNNMLGILKKIYREYQKPSQIRKDSQKNYGLDFEEAIEMAYENIQNEAKLSVKNVTHLCV